MKFNELPILRQLQLAGDIGKMRPDNTWRHMPHQPQLPPVVPAAYVEAQELFSKHNIRLDEHLERTPGRTVYNSPTIGWSKDANLSLKFTLSSALNDTVASLEVQAHTSNSVEDAAIISTHNVVTATIKNRADLVKIKDWFGSHEIEPRINDAVVAMVSSIEEALEQADTITDLDWSLLKPRVSLMPAHRALNNIIYTGRYTKECDDDYGSDDYFSIYSNYKDEIIVENNISKPTISIHVRLNTSMFAPYEEVVVTAMVNGSEYPNPIKVPISLDITPTEYVDSIIDAIAKLGESDEIVESNIKSLKEHITKYLVAAKPAINNKIEEMQRVTNTLFNNNPF